MKSHYLIFIVWCFTYAFGQTESKIVTGTVTYELFWMESDTIESYIEYAYFESAKDEAEIAVNQKIHKSHQIWMPDTSRVSMKLSELFFKELLEDFYSISEKEPNQYNQPWQLNMSTQINPYSKFVQLSISGWEYAGGVHGNGTQFAFLYDREDGHRIQLQEIFWDVESVTHIMENQFRKVMELAPDASLNDHAYWFEDNVFKLNDNYFFRENEFVVYFNTYEIASYATGPIEISVPLDNLVDYLVLEF